MAVGMKLSDINKITGSIENKSVRVQLKFYVFELAIDDQAKLKQLISELQHHIVVEMPVVEEEVSLPEFTKDVGVVESQPRKIDRQKLK